MSEAAATAMEKYESLIGSEEGAGDWFEIDQGRIDQFADVTEDHQFIHVDPEAAKETPFGSTIAHGFLTLSMVTHLMGSVDQDKSVFAGAVMGINYGFDKVRFVSPVKVGSRIRANSTLSNAELKGNAVQVTRTINIEIEGEDRPAVVCEWLTRTIYG